MRGIKNAPQMAPTSNNPKTNPAITPSAFARKNQRIIEPAPS
jgi:hypothetical protein